MGRYENTQIFEDSRRQYESQPRLKAAVDRGKKNQLLIQGDREYPTFAHRERYPDPLKLTVSKKRSLEAAAGYPGERVCVLNFASATNPGGGVTRGAGAQEECLCRCSTLYPCLDSQAMWDGFYSPHRRTGDALHNDDCIYTPDVLVFKSDTAAPELLPESEWYSVDVLTCAAPNLREQPSNGYNPGDGDRRAQISRSELQRLHEVRLRRVLDVAAAREAEVLILGAFGCGAFRNPPEVVAAAARNALGDYRHGFRAVEFAVYCQPGREENYLAFARAFAAWR